LLEEKMPSSNFTSAKRRPLRPLPEGAVADVKFEEGIFFKQNQSDRDDQGVAMNAAKPDKLRRHGGGLIATAGSTISKSTTSEQAVTFAKSRSMKETGKVRSSLQRPSTMSGHVINPLLVHAKSLAAWAQGAGKS